MIANHQFQTVCWVQKDCFVYVFVRILMVGSSFYQGLSANCIMVSVSCGVCVPSVFDSLGSCQFVGKKRQKQK